MSGRAAFYILGFSQKSSEGLYKCFVHLLSQFLALALTVAANKTSDKRSAIPWDGGVLPIIAKWSPALQGPVHGMI